MASPALTPKLYKTSQNPLFQTCHPSPGKSAYYALTKWTASNTMAQDPRFSADVTPPTPSPTPKDTQNIPLLHPNQTTHKIAYVTRTL
ncbi:hypothetical protein CsSME_00036515 [Camellia sinensis var. sinensis]